jgi:putative heme transporter
VTWAESLAAFSAAMVVLFLPVSVGGLGTADAALTGLLAAFGATGSQALAVDVVWRAATFVPQVLTGVVTFLSWRVTTRRRADPRARS